MSNIDIVRRVDTTRAREPFGRQTLTLSVPRVVEEYQVKYKPDFDLELKPVKTVVVGQEPRKGETVPQGTEVTVTMAPKKSLPTDIFVLDDSIAGTYAEKDVGAVIDDLSEKGPGTKAILDQNKQFDALGSDEKASVRKYAEDNLGYTGGEAGLGKVYDDLRFIVNF